MALRSLLVVLLALGGSSSAQSIFPNLSGAQLLDSLVLVYKTQSTLGSAGSKDTLYAVIYNVNDSLSCVYTGFTMYLDPSQDPSQEAFQNGQGINQEHLWPRSKGADVGIAETDMHHLAPTRVDVNSARNNHDFDEIPDPQTDSWWRNDFSTPVQPVQQIDQYSELDTNSGGRFEPREDFKGNVARAMFYFYTMYRAAADGSGDPGFFDRQKEDLRRWNSMDPVDADEIQRTNLIAGYQSGKPNPFVLDTSLIGRAYFGVLTGVEGEEPPGVAEDFLLEQNYPNPFNPVTTIRFSLREAMPVRLTVYDARGARVVTLLDTTMPAGRHELQWDGRNSGKQPVTSGVYYYELLVQGIPLHRKMVLVR